MEKLKAILVDDEFFARENLKMLLEDYASEHVNLIGEAASVKEALELCEKNKVDLVFLDIMMPEADGFAFLEQVKDRGFQVVFTTAFREYAVKAIKENALDYLEKPIDIEELKNVVAKAFKNQGQQTGSLDENKINRVLQEIALHSNFDKTIVPTRDGFVILRNNELIRLEADENYTTLYCVNGKKYVSSKNIKSFEEKLDSHMFMRVHKSHIVNVALHLKEFNRTEGNVVVLSNGDHVPVSRRKLQEFLDKMQE